LNREVVQHGLSKGDQVVSYKGRTCDQQGCTTDHDVHHGQSFCNRIVASLEHQLSASWLIIPFHTDCDFQQLGTQGQASTLGTREVDSKTHSLGIHHELDHSTTPGKLGHVTNR